MARTAAFSFRTAASLTALVTVLLVLTVAFVSPAAAHSGNQTYLYMDVTETSLAGRIEAPIPDVRTALGLGDLSNDEVVAGHGDEVVAYFRQHLELSNEGTTWPVDYGRPELFYSEEAEDDDNYLVVPFTVAFASDDGTVPRTFDLRFDPFVDEIPGRSALLLIGNDWQGGVIDNGFESLTTFDGDSRTQSIDLGNPSWFKNFTASIEQGVDHIRTGPDHILFVLVLLLPSVLAFRSRWWPTEGFGSSLWRVTKIVTMFTVAHSITFTLAGLELLPLPPSKLVEFIIALSIAAAALHNIRPLFPNKEWLLSFVFGLFHGMGFASLVEGLDVSRSTQLVSLLGRNVGIEIGQTVVVFVLFPALYLLRRTRFYRPLFVISSVVMSVIALVWMVERMAEVDLGISAIIDPVFAWPRILYFVIGLTLAAFAFHQTESSAGRLLPTIHDAPPVDGDVDETLERETAATTHG